MIHVTRLHGYMLDDPFSSLYNILIVSGTTAMLTIHNMCAGMVDKFASEDMKQKYLPRLCSLDLMASYCLTGNPPFLRLLR